MITKKVISVKATMYHEEFNPVTKPVLTKPV